MPNDNVIQIRRGFDILLEGEAEKNIIEAPLSKSVDVLPSNFKYLTPKVLVEAGEGVEAGQVLFVDKNNPDIQFCAPVSGIISEVVRGEKRRILAVRILTDKNGIQYRDFPKQNPTNLSAENISLLSSGFSPASVISKATSASSRLPFTACIIFSCSLYFGSMMPGVSEKII